jgi:hypothetical protein
MEGMSGRRIADRLVVGAAIVLAAAIGADELRHHHRNTVAAPAAPRIAAAPVPLEIRLVPSSTAFLARCAADRTSLALAPGPFLVLRYDGPPCHLPPLHLRAVVRSADGTVRYDGPALAGEPLAGNYARDSRAAARLSATAAVCGARASIAGSGLATSGRVRCR